MFGNRRIVILGAARQGKALARWLAAHGARVTLNDSQPAASVDLRDMADVQNLTCVFDGHPLTLLDDCDLLCLSGGVPINLPIVLEARRRGIALSNDAQIFFEVCPAPIIGITGSAGKTTTTTLIGEILKRSAESRVLSAEDAPQHSALSTQHSVWVGGNIGNPLIGETERIRPNDQVVMELSSFQLELMTRSPHIACITNITPNHLDRHGTMDAYIAAKKHILDYQRADDLQVLCADDAVTRTLNTHARTIWFSLNHEPAGEGAWMDDAGNLRVRVGSELKTEDGGQSTATPSSVLSPQFSVDGAICHRRELQLMGAHNILNVLAACAVCAAAGAALDEMRAVATTFKGVTHRLQLVGAINGARYYNDSIATAPERLMAALRCFEQPVVLLCGGRDKYLPWDDAAALMAERCKHVILFGEMGPMVAGVIDRVAGAAFASCRSVVPTLEDAVAEARQLAGMGDVVLLSPGGTSFDAFRDFAARGDAFAALVQRAGGQ